MSHHYRPADSSPAARFHHRIARTGAVLALPCTVLLILGCAGRPLVSQPYVLSAQDAQARISDAEYEVIAERIIKRVVALRDEHPELNGISDGDFDPPTNAVAMLYFEYRTTWALENPTVPHSKTNARFAVFGDGGFWFSLLFYRGRWEGAAMFRPVEFGDLKLWFRYGHGGNTSTVVAVTRVLREENEAFCRLHAWQRLNEPLQRTRPPNQ